MAETAEKKFTGSVLDLARQTGIDIVQEGDVTFWQGNYGAEPVSMHFLSPHGRRLQMFFPCDDGLQPCRRAVIKNMAMGALRCERCITHRISYTEAPAMYARINGGDDTSTIVDVVIPSRAE